jgi:hypothetical protein
MATAVFWVDSLTMGQIGLVTLWLSLAGVDLARSGRPWLGGALAGLAAAIKVTPAVVGVYFLLKRRWIAAAGCAGAFLLCCALSLPVWGPARTASLHRSWIESSAATAGTAFFEDGKSVRYQNQSLHATLARLLMPVNAGRSRRPFRVNVADWPPERVALVARLVQIPVLLLLVHVCLARRREEPLRLPEAAVVLASTTFFAPIAWTFHLVVVLPAAVCLWDRRADREARVWLALIVLFELGVALPVTRALGFLTWSCAAAMLGAFRVAQKERQQEAASLA